MEKEQRIKRKKKNAFCEVELLNGERKIFQFPNDLRSAMMTSYKQKELKKILVGALINIPTSKYNSKGHATLHVGKITNVFIASKNQYWRTRGQFLTEEAWKNKMTLPDVKFILHDHSFLNKIRLLWDLWRWKKRKN